MRSISAIICAAAALLTTAAARPSDDQLFMKSKPVRPKHKGTTPTTLKGYALGMTLDAFRHRPAPSNVYGPTRVVCSDDPAMQAALGPALTPKFPGEVICGFQLLRHRDWELGGLMLDATHDASVVFHFFRGRLVQMESEEDAELSDAILQTLTTQYGQPRRIANRTAQSLRDEVRSQVIVTWINGEDSVVATAPILGTDRMAVVYTDLGAYAAMAGSSGKLM